MTIPSLGTKERAEWERNNPMRPAAHIDVEWKDAPAVILTTETGERYYYPMTPPEAATFIRRVAGFLQQLLKGEL